MSYLDCKSNNYQALTQKWQSFLYHVNISGKSYKTIKTPIASKNNKTIDQMINSWGNFL